MIVHDPKAREDVESRDRLRPEGIWNIDDIDIFYFFPLYLYTVLIRVYIVV